MPDTLLPNHEGNGKETPIKFITSTVPLTMEWVPRHYKMYALNEDEVSRLQVSKSTLPFVFCGICSGVFASFLSVILSGSITDSHKFANCLAVAISTGILAVFFLALGVFNEVGDRRNREEIKRSKAIEAK